MPESKTSPQLWAMVTIAVAIIACIGTVASSIIAKIPIPTLPAFTQTPAIVILPPVVITETPSIIIPPTSFPTVASETVITASNTPEENLHSSNILFNEDFEDGMVQQVIYSNEEWNIVSDETGNYVYDGDNSNGDQYGRFYFGSNSWENYEISFRARIISGSRTIVCFRQDEATYGNYVFDMQLDKVILHYSTHGTDLKPITTYQGNLKRNEWYWINIRVLGSEIRITVNDDVVIFTDDTKHLYGIVVIQAPPHTHSQYDDIKVTALEK